MEHPAFNDRTARLLAASMLAMSASSLLLLPNLGKLALSSANFALCGLLLYTGRPRPDAGARQWERGAIATWLAVSPCLLGFEHVTMSLWVTVACAVLLFHPAAWMAGRREAPQSVETRVRHSQWRRPF